MGCRTMHCLLNAGPACWGCASAADRERVDRFLRKLHRAGYSLKVNFDDLIKPAEEKLLCKVKNNEYHVLRPLFPPLAQRSHSIRPSAVLRHRPARPGPRAPAEQGAPF